MKILVSPIVFNEEKKIEQELRRITKAGVRDYADVIIVNDGSTDRSAEIIRSQGFEMISMEKQSGVGSSIRAVLAYARQNKYDIQVIMAGNNKDEPLEISRLIEPIKAGYDFVQGSRYLSGGKFGNIPWYRQIATRIIHPMLFSLAAGVKITDGTNGFRAIRLSILDDPGIQLNQDWLNEYELEPYLMYKAIKCGYRFKEVPVTKIYPPHHLGYSKMKPFSGWWSILRPIFFLFFGIKK